ncbi:MAG: ATP synthase F1 subunit delta [Eubacteriales bacterium]
MAKLVSKTYGDALFELAKQEGKIEEFAPQVESVLEVFDLNRELIKLMEQPKIVKDEKIKVIEDIFTGKVAKEIVGLMVLLIEKSHYTDMVSVFEYFIEQVKEEKGIGIARITSATKLREEQKVQVEKRLLETTNYTTFEMNFAVDESLIGGMVIRIGDRVVDSSIKTKLYGLSKELKNIQLAI